jgi:hypothetical protein
MLPFMPQHLCHRPRPSHLRGGHKNMRAPRLSEADTQRAPYDKIRENCIIEFILRACMTNKIAEGALMLA